MAIASHHLFWARSLSHDEGCEMAREQAARIRHEYGENKTKKKEGTSRFERRDLHPSYHLVVSYVLLLDGQLHYSLSPLGGERVNYYPTFD